ncbi:MAG TPA: hypothetical protein ENF30_03350 [Candidatus Desulfofervidus auxilii]|uniref:Glutamate synthase alpha subunit C-terminal domain-containing protein n=1 Tax=Desulfofervidus auxilii TaxID=1621989 RepID=A0A7V0IAN8_DESA2|nr:hypothetical protein [Candidatus Desulfofervidus auxilii]
MSVRKLLKKKPDILPLENSIRKTNRIYYEQAIKSHYNKLEEMAKECVSFIKGLKAWEVAKHIERIFFFAERCAIDYNIDIKELDMFFHQVLPRYIHGGLLGCFVSGLCYYVMREKTHLFFDLTYYGTVSGLGYRHSKGTLSIQDGHLPYYLGVEMQGGKIEVFGNAGSYLGRWMKEGSIIVYGNAGSWVGQGMQGGRIEVYGSVRDTLGMRMRGGEIFVDGDAGFWVGEEMQGGCIWIKGRIKSITTDRYGGEVYQWQGRWIKI